MRDDSDTRPGKKDRGQGIGKRLKKARRSLGLTVEGAAQNLHVDSAVLRALENEDFAALGAPVFAKGHLRKYGSLLDLSVDDLLLDYYTKHEPEEQPLKVTDFVLTTRTEKKGQSFTIAFAVTALVALAILVAWLYRKTDVSDAGFQAASSAAAPVAVPVTSPEAESDDSDRDEPVTAGSMALALPPEQDDQTAAPNGESLPGQVLAATGFDDDDADQESVEPDTNESSANETSALSADDAVPLTGFEPAFPPIAIEFEFSEDSWVEVHDGNRQRLIYDLGRASSRRSVNAVPPVQIFLGNALGVRVTIDGRPYEIQSRDIRGQTARFTLGTP